MREKKAGRTPDRPTDRMPHAVVTRHFRLCPIDEYNAQAHTYIQYIKCWAHTHQIPRRLHRHSSRCSVALLFALLNTLYSIYYTHKCVYLCPLFIRSIPSNHHLGYSKLSIHSLRSLSTQRRGVDPNRTKNQDDNMF